MTELKTLKDIDLSFEIDKYIDDIVVAINQKRKIREEAIKWIKMIKNTNEGLRWDTDVNDWIKLFFNITEEEANNV